VNVSAKDLGTGKEQKITITASTNLSKEEIERAVKEAEQYAAEDKRRREEADARNNADNLIYQSEKALSDLGDKVSPEDKSAIQNAIQNVRTALSGNDVQAIKNATDELQKKFFEVSQKIYSQAGPQQGAGGTSSGGGSAPGGGNYYDADYEVVDDNNNK